MGVNSPVQFANAVIKIDTVVVAKVTSARRNVSLQEVEVTGAEDVSGILVDEQFEPVSIGETIDIEGIYVSGAGEGTPTRLEPGQEDLEAAMEAGTAVVLQVLDQNGAGFDYTGFFTSYSESGAVKDVWKFSASLRVNSKTTVGPT